MAAHCRNSAQSAASISIAVSSITEPSRDFLVVFKLLRSNDYT